MSSEGRKRKISRRAFLGATGLGLTAAGTWAARSGATAPIVVAKAGSYDLDLQRIVRDGLAELKLGRASVKGKTILLKPNLVEPSQAAPHINTHPKFVRAVAEVFRSWDAREVLVAEGQGHCRDTEFVLEQSGLGAILDEAGLPFIDLNHDDIYTVPNRLGATRMDELHLPATLKRADMIVSLPKVKTHHWAGVTLSLKNLFGVMPGIAYGWPKNVLHYHGIPRSILDIAHAVRPHLAIADGIIGMDGDGPIMGSPKALGAIVMGTDLPAVDATCARLMDLDPWRIWYLANADGRIGTVDEGVIEQRGETIAATKQRFALLDHPSMKVFRD